MTESETAGMADITRFAPGRIFWKGVWRVALGTLMVGQLFLFEFFRGPPSKLPTNVAPATIWDVLPILVLSRSP